MARYVQGKDGKFAGSIGDGKTAVPTGSDIPRTPNTSAGDFVRAGRGFRCAKCGAGVFNHPPTDHSCTPTSAYTDAYSAYLTQQGSTPEPINIPNPTDAHAAAPQTAEQILNSLNNPDEWKRGTYTNDSGRYTLGFVNRNNPDITIEMDDPFGHEKIIQIGKTYPITRIVTRGEHAVSSTLYTKDRTYETRSFSPDGQLNNTDKQAAVVVINKGEPVEHHFYTNGQHTGTQRWRTLYDAEGKEIEDTLFNRRKQKKATGGLGEQPPGYTAFR